MSLIYGVWSRGREIPREWVDYLHRQGMARHLAQSWTGRRVYLGKMDIGAFEPGWSSTQTRVTAIAGDAIITGQGRPQDVAALESGDVEPLLRRSRGYFNLARFDGELILANDRLGMRPLYIYDDGELVVFCGALKIIEKLPGVRLTMDLAGVLETAAFGFPLAERTRYREVSYLSGGTIWRNGVTSRYWTWEPQPVRDDIEAVMDEMYAAFQEAIRLRCREPKVFASLSGGLDSRCIATELWKQGAEVQTLNVSWPGSYDDVLGRMYAGKLGVTHHFKPRDLNDSGNTLTQHLFELSRASQIWGGDDASLTIGHNRQTKAAIDKLRAGDKEAAAREFLRVCKIAVSGKLLKDRSAWAEALPLRSLLDEMPECDERTLWFFRLRNHHRRIVAFHLEEIDLVPFEFIEPLADPEVIQLCASLPIDFCLGHNMYHEWLKRFPQEIVSVAWQNYPGHLPSPTPLPPQAQSQWAIRKESSRSKLSSLTQAWRQLRREKSALVSRRAVSLAYLLHGLGVRDTSHLLRQVELLEAAGPGSERQE